MSSQNTTRSKQQELEDANSIKVPDGSQKQQPTGEQAAHLKPQVSDQHKLSNQQSEQQVNIFRKNLVIPKRKNPKVGGTFGRHTEVEVNYLPLNLDKLFKKTVYHIDCQFTPESPKRLLRIALERFVDKHYPGTRFAFDGRKYMFTTKELKREADLITVLNEENGKSIDFAIVTSVVKQINMSMIQEYLNNGSSNCPPIEAFQVIDIVLKNRPFSLRYTNIGRSFFPIPRIIPVDLGEGMEFWEGFFQSRVMGWKPYLNIDVVHKGFPKHQLLTLYIQNELNCSLGTELDFKTRNVLLNYIKGLKVDFMIPNQPNSKRTFKVVGLLDSAAKFTFEMNNNNKIGNTKTLTVFQYYKSIRNYVIKYSNLPCLHVGNINKTIAIPIELCTVKSGQLRMKKLTENQTEEMVRNSTQPPANRRQMIENCIRDVKYNQDPVLKEFGVEIQEKFANIPARVLDQPSLSYFQNREIKPKAGIWKPDQFQKSIKLSRWILLNLDVCVNMSIIKDFERYLIRSGKELNMIINPMVLAYNYSISNDINETKRFLIEFLNKIKKMQPPMEIVVVVIPDVTEIYKAVKKSSDVKVGILTQCIQSNTMKNLNHSTARNILLKINSKLNGVNHTLSPKSCLSSMNGAIIFGADVTHPSPDQTSVPSISAVTASHDLYGSQYNMEWRLQPPNEEVIQDLENIVHIQLLKYMDKTKAVPRRILYFRDGVSESRFVQLLEFELVAIRRACLRLNMEYKPPITMLVVQKRHHTKLFPKHSQDMDGKCQNVPSGTVIDTQITHPTEVNFYLCSQASIQGTSRPTKYHLIWDDNKFTDDELEELTFNLCFMFVRCTRSVSYPAPTYYAHLAAYRARTYIENKKINLNRLDEEQVKNQINKELSLENPMFFI